MFLNSFRLINKLSKETLRISSILGDVSGCIPTFQQVCYFQVSVTRLKQIYSRSPFKTGSPNRVDKTDRVEVENPETLQFQCVKVSEPSEQEVDAIIERSVWIPARGHQVLVIQPFTKTLKKRRLNTTPELQLDEAITLIKTLENWSVVDGFTVPISGKLDRPMLFGSETQVKIKQYLEENQNVTAMFISLNTMSWTQHIQLEDYFDIPIYDRYAIVMQIFREHAKTKEAKLQIQLAEIPYIWARLKGAHLGSLVRFGGESAREVGSLGRTFIETRRSMLRNREVHIRNELTKLHMRRKRIREHRAELEIPIVAVVGYTNAGKTSLIKALTGSERLEPRNCLFATLDVTAHAGVLPSNLECLYMDTVGFISDIPTDLIEAFKVTLEDAMVADVIIHIRDISHPDTEAQNDEVENVLSKMEIDSQVRDNIIVVGNKIDLVPSEELKTITNKNSDLLYVSAETLHGIDNLRYRIENLLMKNTSRKSIVIRVLSGGEEYQWLCQETTVFNMTPDPKDNQYLLLKVIITDAALSQFKHKFIKQYKG